MIVFAAAFGLNYELGRESGVPLWHLPDEYNRFQESIKGHPIVFGRKSYDVVKKPLPGSLNIVITRNKDYDGKGATVVNSLDEALEAAGNAGKIYIVGGGGIFKLALSRADRLEVSRINGTFPEATAFFPEIDESEWECTHLEKHEKDDKHAYSFTFETWERKQRKP